MAYAIIGSTKRRGSSSFAGAARQASRPRGVNTGNRIRLFRGGGLKQRKEIILTDGNRSCHYFIEYGGRVVAGSQGGRGLFVVSGKDLLDFHKQTMADAKKEKESLLMNRMLNADEVATLLSTTPRSLRRWDEEGYLKSVRIGGVNKWRYQDVLNLMNGGEAANK